MVFFRTFLVLMPLVLGACARDLSNLSFFFPEDMDESVARNEIGHGRSLEDTSYMHLRSAMLAGGNQLGIQTNGIDGTTKPMENASRRLTLSMGLGLRRIIAVEGRPMTSLGKQTIQKGGATFKKQPKQRMLMQGTLVTKQMIKRNLSMVSNSNVSRQKVVVNFMNRQHTSAYGGTNSGAKTKRYNRMNRQLKSLNGGMASVSTVTNVNRMKRQLTRFVGGMGGSRSDAVSTGNFPGFPKNEVNQVQGSLNERTVANNVNQIPDQYNRTTTFDFIVGGFPKCGTTTILKAFALHPETDMASSEQCSIASPGQADFVVLRKLDETLADLSTDSAVKRSFKCPTAMYSYKSIVRLEKHSPTAKFIVGVRHPVRMIQSFYNYRVTEIYERNLYGIDPIPSFSELMESKLSWKGVSLASVRFDLFLMQFGKTNVTSDDMNTLSQQNYELAIKPSNFSMFLYSVDQLEDTDETRSEVLRVELQKYLGLNLPIEPFGHENKNHAVGTTGHAESINICDQEYAPIRKQILEYGEKSAAWLRDHFITSPDVIVANKEHFVESLESWGVDPCDDTVAEA